MPIGSEPTGPAPRALPTRRVFTQWGFTRGGTRPTLFHKIPRAVAPAFSATARVRIGVGVRFQVPTLGALAFRGFRL